MPLEPPEGNEKEDWMRSIALGACILMTRQPTLTDAQIPTVIEMSIAIHKAALKAFNASLPWPQ